MVSTPTIEGISAIAREFEASDKRYFFVPCPFCGGIQHLKWEFLKWKKGKYDTVYYECEHCKEKIHERHKVKMLPAGEWIPTELERVNESSAGYHINSLYSPFGWYSWAEAAQQWELAQNDTPRLKTFINTVLGETWKEKGEAPPWENIYNRRETYALSKPKKQVAFITAGVDVQADRLEVEIVGWCEGKISYSLDYRILHGDTAKDEVWDQLATIVNEDFEREDNVLIPLKMMAIDSGYNTNYVYNFCRRFDSAKVIPVKGQDKQTVVLSAPKAVDVTIAGERLGRVKLWHVGVSILKSETYSYLKLNNIGNMPTPSGYCHFPEYGPEYFKGLTGEELQLNRNKKGYIEYTWVKKYNRNEPLDCRVYARAAAEMVGMSRMNSDAWERARNEVSHRHETTTAQKKAKRPSIWDR